MPGCVIDWKRLAASAFTDKGHASASRIQRRLIHVVSQLAEGFLITKLVPNIPVPSNADQFHPAKTRPVDRLSPFSALAIVPFLAYVLFQSELRDGRKCRREAKVKHVMALERFLSRNAGFATSTKDDLTLHDLNMSDFCPSQMMRPLHRAF